MEWQDIAQRIKAGGYRRQKTYDTFGFILTEELIIPSARMEDIDLDAFRAFLRAQGLDTEEEPQSEICDQSRDFSKSHECRECSLGWESPIPQCYGILLRRF